MDEEGIACDFQKTGRYVAQWLPKHFENTSRQFEAIQSLAPVEAKVVPLSRQPNEITTNRYFGGILYHHHGSLNPARWVKGLQQAAQRAGAAVQGNTLVTSVEKSGPSFCVTTVRGKVTAGDVLIATNGYTHDLQTHVNKGVFPVPSFIITTEELGTNRVRALIPHGRMIVETRERHCYYRPSPDGKRLVFGGRVALFQASSPDFSKQLKKLMTGIFPTLNDARVSHCWKGNTSFTFNTFPHLGKIDGIWHALGYCGNGNSMAPYLGHKAALQILNEPEGNTIFSQPSLSTKWWCRNRPWFLPFADVTFRFRDLWSNIQNRRAS